MTGHTDMRFALIFPPALAAGSLFRGTPTSSGLAVCAAFELVLVVGLTALCWHDHRTAARTDAPASPQAPTHTGPRPGHDPTH